MKKLNNLKLFEEFKSGYIDVPPNFDDNLAAMGQFNKQLTDVYSVPTNQLKIDLFYGLKSEIKDYLSMNNVEKSADTYSSFLNSEIDGILYKYSEGKFDLIAIEDKEELKKKLWEMIDAELPYDEVKYDQHLAKTLRKLLDEFIEKYISNDNKV